MNATLCRTTDVELELNDLVVSIDEVYETAPMVAVTPLPQIPDEEELHMEFEEALRERTTAFGSRLHCLKDATWYTEVSSILLPASPLTMPTTEPLSEAGIIEKSSVDTDQIDASQMQGTKHKLHSFLSHKVQRAFIYSCCALSCTLLGFDMMGLLILHVH